MSSDLSFVCAINSLPYPIIGRILAESGNAGRVACVCKLWNSVVSQESYPLMRRRYRKCCFLKHDFSAGTLSARDYVCQSLQKYYSQKTHFDSTLIEEDEKRFILRKTYIDQFFQQYPCPIPDQLNLLEEDLNLIGFFKEIKSTPEFYKIKQLMKVEHKKIALQPNLIRRVLMQLIDGPEIVSDEFVMFAAKNSLNSFIQELLERNKITPEGRQMAIVEAAKLGNQQLVELLLENFSDDPTVLFSALKAAVKYGHEDTAHFLLKKCNYDIQSLSELIIPAPAEDNVEQDSNLHCIQLVIAEIIESPDLQDLILLASHGCINQLLLLLKNVQFEKLNLEGAIFAAAKNGHADAVRALMSIDNGAVSERTKVIALGIAAKRGHSSVFEALLHVNGKLSLQDRDVVLMSAVEGGSVRILNMLLDDGEITEEKRGLAVIKSTQLGHINLVRSLLDNGNIRECDRIGALQWAVDRNYGNLCGLLVRSGEFHEQDKQKVIDIAVKMERWGIYQLFESGESVDRRNLFISYNVGRKLTPGYKKFLENNLSSFSSSTCYFAFLKAIKAGNLEVAALLLSNLKAMSENQELFFAAINKIAAKSDRNYILLFQHLKDLGWFNEESLLDFTSHSALTQCNFEVFNLLTDDRKISEECASQALVYIVNEGEPIDKLQLLRQYGEFSGVIRYEGICNAIQKDRIDMIDFLLSDGPMSEDDLHELWRVASQYNRINVINYFKSRSINFSDEQ